MATHLEALIALSSSVKKMVQKILAAVKREKQQRKQAKDKQAAQVTSKFKTLVKELVKNSSAPAPAAMKQMFSHAPASFVHVQQMSAEVPAEIK
eukprot:4691485-Pyramimonas_sp.AAC.1